MLLKTSAHAKCYDSQLRWMYFFIKNNWLLKKSIILGYLGEKVSFDIKKEFDSKPVYDEKIA